MKLIAYFLNFLVILCRAMAPAGLRSIAAENTVLKIQLAALTRKHKRARPICSKDKLAYAFFLALIKTKRIARIAYALHPSTLLHLHKVFVKRKYKLLYSNKRSNKPGPKGPEPNVIAAIPEMKRCNPRYGYRRIAMQIKAAFGVDIDKDLVRRVLSKALYENPHDKGPSWLTFLSHMKDSLWSIDFFRCESIHLQSHWVMVAMDQYSRKIVGFAVHKGELYGAAICCMFKRIAFANRLPSFLSTDNDPLFNYSRFQANLRILNIRQIKSIPFVPISHPFIERLIGSILREYLDHILFFNERDLQRKLEAYQNYYNEHRCHESVCEKPPASIGSSCENKIISLEKYRFESHCQGLYKLPVAA